MARSKRLNRRPHTLPRRALRSPERLFRLQGEALESRLLLSGYGDEQMRFEPNLGQTDPQALFLSRGEGYSLFLTANQAVLNLPAADGGNPVALTMSLVGADPHPHASGVDELAAKSNYLRGQDRSHWITGVPNYGQVEYHDVYPGVDLIYHGSGQQLEYDFTVAPGGDPSSIVLSFQGAERMSVDADGNLVLATAAGDIVEHAPVIYQGDGAERRTVTGGYALGDEGQVGFSLGDYDHSRPLVIDPMLAYSTYLGKSDAGLPGYAEAHAVAVDKLGYAYLTGRVSDAWDDFVPTTNINTVQPLFDGYGNDAFVTKLDPTGQVVFSTYLGGRPDEGKVHTETIDGYPVIVGRQAVDNEGNGIALHDDGAGGYNIYVAGTTSVLNSDTVSDLTQEVGFSRTVHAFQPEFGGGYGYDGSPIKGGGDDAFVAELTADGGAYVYSSYLGGQTNDSGSGIAVDAAGNAYVVGSSTAYEGVTWFDGTAAFVARVNADGGLDWKNLFGSESDRSTTTGSAIAVDNAGGVYIAGETNSGNFATEQPVAESVGGFDAYAVKLSAAHGGPMAAARLGGTLDEYASGLALDRDGNVYLTGTTFSANFPATAGAFQTTKPRPESFVASAFVSKLSADLSKLVYSTYLGGSQGVTDNDDLGNPFDMNVGEFGHAIAVDSAGDAVVVGSTGSTDFPTVNGIQTATASHPRAYELTSPDGPSDAFVAELDANGRALKFSTYLGGRTNDVATGVALDPSGSVYVVGITDSTNFPTQNAVQPSYTRPDGGPIFHVDTSSDDNFAFTGAGSRGVTSAFVTHITGSLHVVPQPIYAELNRPFSGVVATFTAPLSTEQPSDFVAGVDWGDGSDSKPSVLQPGGPGTTLYVFANHTYTKLGVYPVKITVDDNRLGIYGATAATSIGDNRNLETGPTIINPENSRYLNISGTNGLHSAILAQTDGHRGDGDWYQSGDDVTQSAIEGAHGPSTGDNFKIAHVQGASFVLFQNPVTYEPSLYYAVDTYGHPSLDVPLTFLYRFANGESGTVAKNRAALGVGPITDGQIQGGEVWLAFVVDDAIHVYVVDVLGAGNIVSHQSFSFFAPAEGDIQVDDVAVGPDGRAAIAFETTQSGQKSKIWVATTSSDLLPGEEIADISHVDDTTVTPGYPIPDIEGIDAGVRLAWDDGKGPSRGRLYIVYTQAFDALQTFLEFRFQDAAGSWGGAISYGDPGGLLHTGNEYWPSIAVNQATGDVAVAWYDTRLQVEARTADISLALYSPFTGQFSSVIQVNHFATHVTPRPDSTSLVFSGGFAYPAWVDDALPTEPKPYQFALAASALAAVHVVIPPPKVKPEIEQDEEEEQDDQAPAMEVAKTQFVMAKPAAAEPAASAPDTPYHLTLGQAFSGVVAVLNDADETLQASDFTALVDWGDGTAPTAGEISPAPPETGDKFVVSGSHLYARSGAFPITVRVHDTVHNLESVSVVDVTQQPGSEINGSLAIDPTNPNRRFVVSDADGELAAAVSGDGGAAWARQTLASGGGGLFQAPADGLPAADGQAKAAFDAYGNLFLTYVSADDSGGVVVALSVDGGNTFSVLARFADRFIRPALATGPGAGGLDGGVWLTFTSATDGSLWAVNAPVSGKGAVGAFTAPYQQSFGDAAAAASDVAVGPDGQALYVIQSATNSYGESDLVVALAQTEGPPNQGIIAAPINLSPGELIPAQDAAGIETQAQLAWDQSTGPHRGRLYLAYVDAAWPGDTDTDIFLIHSDDQGKNWSDATRVNDDQGPASQFQPAIAVDQKSGDVGVSWRDARNDLDDAITEVFTAVSADGGRTFSANVVVSPGSSDAADPNLDPLGRDSQYGRYADLAFLDGMLYPLWADNSASLGPGDDLPRFDIAVGAYQVIDVTPAPITASALDVAGAKPKEGVELTADLAAFTDPDPNATAGDFTAAIQWGDQTTADAATIRQEGDGSFVVSGTHTYLEEGGYTITVNILGSQGQSAEATSSAVVKDAKLTAAGHSLQPAAGVVFAGAAATFTDENPNGSPADYQTTIDWGDGTTTSGQVVYDGTAALADGLMAIGRSSSGPDAGTPYLMQIVVLPQGGPPLTYPLMPLTAQFHGGLSQGPDFQPYAISINDVGESFLNRLTPNAAFPQAPGRIDQVAYLGLDFTGGLTYADADGVFYAVAQEGAAATLYSIDPKTYAVQAVGGLGDRTFSGLAYDPSGFAQNPPEDLLYAIANDSLGVSTLYEIDLAPALATTPLTTLGTGFSGGLALRQENGAENLYAIAGDGDGAATLFHVHLRVAPEPLGGLGDQFNQGYDVIGSHAYAAKAPFTIQVAIDDVGGSSARAQSQAQVVDEPPVGLPPPPAFTAFQGFATGTLTLAEFIVPGGAAFSVDQFTASVVWLDGSAPEQADVALTGGKLVVTSAGHSYPIAGTLHPLVILTDDSGNSAVVADTVDVLPDVTKQVKPVGLGGPVTPSTGILTSSGTATNLGNVSLKGPFYLVVQGLPSGVTLADADGTLPSGEPYRLVNVPELSPGQTVNVSLHFSDPTRTPFTYHVTVIDGPFGLVTPVGAVPGLGVAGPGFVANVGQTDEQSRYLSQGDGYTLFLTSSGAVLNLLAPDDGGAQAPTAAALGLQWVGANTAAEPVGLDPLAGQTNYLMGNDPSQWTTGEVSYARVEYRDVYPGVSLDYHSSATERLEYDFTVAPGADPSVIRLAVRGADGVSIDAAGNLTLSTSAGDVVEQAPVAYQQINGVRVAVASAYVIEADGMVAFRIGAYDASLPLVIDPVLVFSTYLGGSAREQGNGIAVDAAGNVYVTGQTQSLDFPTLGGFGAPPDRLGEPGGGPVAFVTKYDAAGALVYSTYFGGSGEIAPLGGLLGDLGQAIAVDAAGEAVVTGTTYSFDFPVINALSASPPPGLASAFAAKLNAAGTGFVFSTYLQGASQGAGVALDAAGNIYLAGQAEDGLPPAYAFATTPNAASSSVSNGFIEKLSPSGDSVLYATYVPGTARTQLSSGQFVYGGNVNALAVDAAGNAYVTGVIYGDGPALGSAQPAFGGGQFDAFAAKLNTTGTAFDYWTYLGGADNDVGNAIAVDAAGAAYVAGTTMSDDFPTAGAAQQTFGGIGLDAIGLNDLRGQGAVAGDAFAAKLSPDGSSFVYSTYLGGSGPDIGAGIAVDAAGNAYVTGQAGAADFPTVHAVQPAFGGDLLAGPFYDVVLGQGDAFLTRLSATGATLDYSTFLGGSGADRASAVAVTAGSDAVVTGFTNLYDFPTINAAQPSSNLPLVAYTGQTTAFVARIAAQGPGGLQVANVPFQPTEGIGFTGVVASFTDTKAGSASDYSATIDWGDGTTSQGVVSFASGDFQVSGDHTYAEEGAYPVSVSVRDADGATASATETTFGQSAGGPVTYRVSVDTSALAGSSGFLDFQLNPGALPDAQSVGATIDQFNPGGGTLGAAASTGGAAGSLAGGIELANSGMLNELEQGLTFGGSLSFDVTLQGDALRLPLDGLFGSTFSLTLLSADGATALETTQSDGALFTVSVGPSGSTRLLSGAKDGIVRATAINAISVADAALQVSPASVQATEGAPFTGTVATFNDANTAALASDFAASILWGDGPAASAGTVVADGNGQFHVIGAHTYVEVGTYPMQVAVQDKGGAAAKTPLSQATANQGLLAGRFTYTGRFEPSNQLRAVGDFNGDGVLDIAVPPSDTNTYNFLVLLGNSDGSFAPTSDEPVVGDEIGRPFLLTAVVAGDFNSDGKLDLAVAGPRSGVKILLGNGDGTFQTAIDPLPDQPDLLMSAVTLTTGDFNGDGNLDLVVSTGNDSDGSALPAVSWHSVLLGNGDGSFNYSRDRDIFLGSTATNVLAPDVDGDGKLDLVVTDATHGQLYVLLGQGDGRFPLDGPVHSARITTPLPQGAKFDVVADFNGDGIPDVAVTGNDVVSVLLGNGDGTFSTPATYAAPGAFDVFAADYNHDGLLDLLVSDPGLDINNNLNFEGTDRGALYVLLGKGDGVFAPAIAVTDVADPAYLASGDFNGDGKQDALFTSLGQGITVLSGRGDGSFVTAQRSPILALPDHGQGSQSFDLAAAADLNGDGNADAILFDRQGYVHVELSNGDGTFQADKSVPPLGLGHRTVEIVAVGDLNGDGNRDIVLVNQFLQSGSTHYELETLFGNGDGTFQPRTSSMALPTRTVALGDVNGDGRLDLVVDTGNEIYVANEIYVYPGNGDGAFLSPIRTNLPSTNVAQIELADVDGDGKLDIVSLGVGSYSPSQVWDVDIIPGNGDGTFSLMAFRYEVPANSRALTVADVNGDGKPDLIFVETFIPDYQNNGKYHLTSPTNNMAVMLNNGDGAFSSPVSYVDYTVGFENYFAIATADVNGDGKPDILATKEFVSYTSYYYDYADPASYGMSVLFNQGNGTFGDPAVYDTASTSLGGLAVADFNNDGKPDVLLADGFDEAFTTIYSPAPNTQPGFAHVADAPLSATGLDHSALVGATFLGAVAHFDDANPLAPTSDFTATVAWGDRQTSAGTVVADPAGGFVVLGTHVYAAAGTENVSVAILDRDGSTANASGTIAVTTTPDAPLTAASVPVAATARAPFTGVVANFTDADPAGSAQDFTATIDWGDGQTSPGFVRAAGGGFEVVGAHTYAEAGSYTTSIRMIDTGGATADATGVAVAAANTDPPLSPTSVTFQATEQMTFSGIVASFTDADPQGQTTDYSATIAWGDGSSSRGTVSPDPTVPGQFDVLASHGYLAIGSYAVTVSIADREGAAAVANSTAVVEDAALTGLAHPVTATEGAAWKGVIASFIDANPFSAAGDFTATIAWGDGHVSTGTVTSDSLVPGRFDVTGANTYAEAGIFPIDVSVADDGGAAASIGSAADVADAPLTATGATAQAAEGAAFTAVIATFNDGNTSGGIDEYTATIMWGDGRTSPGNVAPNAAGGFDVSGTHAYDVAGAYALRISILDRGGASALAEGMVQVAGAVVEGTAEYITATEGALFAGAVASFTSEGAPRQPSDFVATIDWGDGQTSVGVIVEDLATREFEIIGSNTYAEESATFYDYVTITVADRGGVVATIYSYAYVYDAPLTTGAALTVRAIKDEPVTAVLATFTDANPAAAAGDYTAYIYSGEQFVYGTITADPQIAGQFDVTGSLLFTDLGDFPVEIDISDRGWYTFVISAVTVSMVPTAAGTSSQAAAGVSFNTAVATIEDQNPGEQPSDFRANIDWGDGHQSPGLLTYDPDNAGVFRVLGSSAYTEAGSYSVTVDLVRGDGLSLTAASTVDVSAAGDLPLTTRPAVAIDATQNVAVNALAAIFTDADPTATVDDFTATIQWGDGASSGGTVVALSGQTAAFGVGGQHVYADTGTHFITVEINDVGGASTTAIAAIDVSPNETPALPTTTNLSSDFAAGSTYGQTVTFTAMVGAADGTPTGSVDFVDQTTGQDLGSATLAILNGVNVASVSVTGLAAASHTIVASYASDASGFQNSQDTLAQLVNLATLTVTADNKARIYGSANPFLTDTITGFVNGDAASVVSGSASLSTTATAAAGVGDYAITVGPGTLNAANYTFAFADGTQSITPATLIVSAGNADINHGDPVPSFSYTITGFVNSDPASVVSGAPSFSTPAGANQAAGVYAISGEIGSLAAANYAFQFVGGALTVHPTVIDVRVQWGGQSMSLLNLNRDLPFININAIDVIFSDDVVVTEADLLLTGVNVPSYLFSGFRYDAALHEAIWSLPTALAVDRLMMQLDGTSANGVHAAQGNIAMLSDLSQGFAVLPGDFNADGIVSVLDAVGVLNQAPLAAAHSVWADLDGNGIVDMNDYLDVRYRIGKKLP